MKYVSFYGFVETPENVSFLQEKHPFKEPGESFRNFSYECISGRDIMAIYLAIVGNGVGHLVASCLAGGWEEETFCILDEHGKPKKAKANFNPNTIEQL